MVKDYRELLLICLNHDSIEKFMPNSKEQTYTTIVSCLKNEEDRRWLAQEVMSLGTKFPGLDDIPLDSVSILATLFTTGMLDDDRDCPKFGEYTEALSQYQLISKSQSTERVQLTAKGESACNAIFIQVSTRNRIVNLPV